MTDAHIRLDLDDHELADLLGGSVEDIRRDKAAFNLVYDVARSIREARLSKQWTQKQLAERLGITVGRVSQYETGDLRHAPNLKTLAEIAHVLDMEIGIALRPRVEAAYAGVGVIGRNFSLDAASVVDLSVGEAAAMDAGTLAVRLHDVADKVVREHPDIEPSPLLSEEVRALIVEDGR